MNIENSLHLYDLTSPSEIVGILRVIFVNFVILFPLGITHCVCQENTVRFRYNIILY